MYENKNINYVNQFWGKNAATSELEREDLFPLVDIQTTIAWVMINKYISSGSTNINNLLDAGAGVGRYSLPLAKIGINVTHLDISQHMIKIAQKVANSEGLENINFLEGSITNLDCFEDQIFDASLCFDAPISYAYPNHLKALQEVARVTKKYLFLMVSNRNGIIPFMIDFDISRQYLPPGYKKSIDPFYVTKEIMYNGVERWPEEIQNYLKQSSKEAPLDYAFSVTEIYQEVEKLGFKIIDIGGPGALARNISSSSLEKIRNHEKLFDEFIKLSLQFDFDINNIGLGAVNLFIVAERDNNFCELYN